MMLSVWRRRTRQAGQFRRRLRTRTVDQQVNSHSLVKALLPSLLLYQLSCRPRSAYGGSPAAQYSLKTNLIFKYEPLIINDYASFERIFA